MTGLIHSSNTSGARVARVSLLDALAEGSERWDALAACSGCQSPFMRRAWHDAWAQSASPDELQTSFGIVLSGGDGMEGILPLAIRSMSFRRAQVRALTWAIGDVGCPDHLDIPATGDVDVAAAIPLLEPLPWQAVILGGVAADAENVRRLTDALQGRGYTVRRTPLAPCPYIELPSTWDEYLASLSKSRRQTIRWQERKLGRDHAMVITDYTPDQLDEGWRRLRSLHNARWAGRGSLGEDRLDRLLRSFSSDLAARDELWLTTLDLDGQPAAAWHGFACGDTVYFYQSGRDPKWGSASVGLVLLGAMIRRAIERGYRRFDFLRGQDGYKTSWTSTERWVYEVVAIRPGWRGAWLRGLDLAGRMRERFRPVQQVATHA